MSRLFLLLGLRDNSPVVVMLERTVLTFGAIATVVGCLGVLVLLPGLARAMWQRNAAAWWRLVRWEAAVLVLVLLGVACVVSSADALDLIPE